MKPAALVRPATDHDLLGLMSVKPDEALHRERLARQHQGEWTYLVAAAPPTPPHEARSTPLYGHVVLVWGGDEHHLGYPVLADLLVRETFRGQGIGTRLLTHAEWLCRDRGQPRLGLSVNPVDNPRAHTLYLRLGYVPTDAPPHCDLYPRVDEQGRFSLYEDWCICLVKALETLPVSKAEVG